MKDLSQVEKVALGVGLLGDLLSPERNWPEEQSAVSDTSDFLTLVAEIQQQVRDLADSVDEDFRLALMTDLIRAEIAVNAVLDEVEMRGLSGEHAEPIYREGLTRAAETIEADFGWHEARLFALAALSTDGAESPTQAARDTDDEWFHSPGAKRSGEYSEGPLVGTKKDLGAWLGGPGGDNDRTLNQKGASGAVWVIRYARSKFEVWFRDSGTYAKANKKRLEQ